MRLLPRINMKRPLWRGGPQLDEIVQAQLQAPANAVPAPADDSGDDDEQAAQRRATELLLLLR